MLPMSSPWCSRDRFSRRILNFENVSHKGTRSWKVFGILDGSSFQRTPSSATEILHEIFYLKYNPSQSSVVWEILMNLESEGKCLNFITRQAWISSWSYFERNGIRNKWSIVLRDYIKWKASNVFSRHYIIFKLNKLSGLCPESARKLPSFLSRKFPVHPKKKILRTELV